MSAGKWLKLGSIKKGKTGNQYMALGSPKSSYEPVNVTVVVTDLTGKVLAEVTNPNLSIQNPRKRPGATQEQIDRIPDYLLADVSLAPERKE